ncbi:Ribonuclease E/G [Syntrophomonas zehnderi OL-4]|uniref:Ribonuclease E/G n=1 Tax=Syntrophomonas zehnderi OL-4 TaxID=690567 RepID=A0A0E4GBA8_9FIRM|nr:Rne/Rng family ribonuclease [Syntrophomonas zehnderi]CFX80322.1 Ribonuclease E/G [Syntrophomonas zehnderi OL-4]
MVRDIIAEVYPWESRIAIIEDDRLVEVFWANQEENVGKIYKGKVKDVLPGLSCAFVDIGLSKNAFLYVGDVAVPEHRKGTNIYDYLKSGQDIMVQVKKEAFSEKGARVTGNLTIPGHLLVLLPLQKEISISRKIVGNQKRNYLRNLIEEHKSEDVGVILRTACLEADDAEIKAELDELIQVWHKIKKRYQHNKSPSVIYEDIDVIERTLRDYLDGGIRHVIINNLKLKERFDQFIKNKNTSYDLNIRYVKGDLFEKYGLEKDIRKALRRKVWLKSGGYLIFDETEAMTVIDVNSGKFTGKDNFEETVHRLNLEAAVEIPRQLRLRSIGGIILIDFIDMKDKYNEENVISILRQELEKDKAHTRIMGMSGLGFLEMTRKKSRYGISEIFTDECNACHGRGRTINVFALACELKRKLANLDYLEGEEIICEAHPELLQYITNDEKNLNYIKKKTGKRIKLVAKQEMQLEDYNLHSS